jgi:4-hydroxy-tetrahydrodipicolinate synthase
MNQPSKHRGTIVPMVTPLTAGGTLDEPALKRLVARLAENGHGLFVLGTTGEAASVPPTMRRRLVELTVAGAAGRVPVFAGIGDNCVVDSIAAADDYLRLGINAVVAHLPSYYLLDPPEMQAYFELLARNIHGPLVLYNIPQATHMSVPVAVVERLAALPNVIGFKDSENIPGRLEQVAERLGGRPGFSIFMGSAVLAVQALRRGYDGLVPGSGNLVPELWRQLYARACARQWDAAEALQHRLDAVARIFQRNRTLGQSLAALKAAMEARGLCGPTVLPPLRTLDAAARAAIRAELAAQLDLGPPTVASAAS